MISLCSGIPYDSLLCMCTNDEGINGEALLFTATAWP